MLLYNTKKTSLELTILTTAAEMKRWEHPMVQNEDNRLLDADGDNGNDNDGGDDIDSDGNSASI